MYTNVLQLTIDSIRDAIPKDVIDITIGAEETHTILNEVINRTLNDIHANSTTTVTIPLDKCSVSTVQEGFIIHVNRDICNVVGPVMLNYGGRDKDYLGYESNYTNNLELIGINTILVREQNIHEYNYLYVNGYNDNSIYRLLVGKNTSLFGETIVAKVKHYIYMNYHIAMTASASANRHGYNGMLDIISGYDSMGELYSELLDKWKLQSNAVDSYTMNKIIDNII